jgi:hypothetical protein
MTGTQPNDRLIPSTEAGDSSYPAQNTRSKTPANAARAAPPKAPGAGKGKPTRAAINLEEGDDTAEDDAVPNSQRGIPLPKRSRTLTASREAQEIEDRARLMAARLTLARLERETKAFNESGENPGLGGIHRRRMHRLCGHKDDAHPRRGGRRPRTLVRDPCRDHGIVLHSDHCKGRSPGRRRRDYQKGCPQRLYRDLPELQQVRLRKTQLQASARVLQMWQQIARGKGLQEVGNGGGQGSSACTKDPRPRPPQPSCTSTTQHRTTLRNLRPTPASA